MFLYRVKMNNKDILMFLTIFVHCLTYIIYMVYLTALCENNKQSYIHIIFARKFSIALLLLLQTKENENVVVAHIKMHQGKKCDIMVEFYTCNICLI